MLKAVLTTTGIALAVTVPALAGSEPWPADRTMTVAQADAAGQGTVQPQVEQPSGTANTGSISQTAKEVLPEETTSGDTSADTSGPGPQVPVADVPTSDAPNGIVPPELVAEVRQMALDAEKNAPTPPAKTEEQAAAEQRSIESHREAFLAAH